MRMRRRIGTKVSEGKKTNKETPLAEVLQKNCHRLSHNRSCSPYCRHPHVNSLVAQAISIQTLAALCRQHLRAIVRSGRKVVYGFCRLQTLPCLRIVECPLCHHIYFYVPRPNIKFMVLPDYLLSKTAKTNVGTLLVSGGDRRRCPFI
jgi:hypothetical protein